MSGGLSRTVYTKCKGKVDPTVVEQMVHIAEEVSALKQAMTELAKVVDQAIGLMAYNNELHSRAFRTIESKIGDREQSKEIPR